MSNETISLTLETRSLVGKQVKTLRAGGTVPAVIHDHGKDSIVVQGNAVALLKAWHKAGKHHPIEVTADGKKYTTLIKAATFNPKKHTLTHIVFNAVKANEKVQAEVPVHAQYAEGNDSAPAERAGLLVLAQLENVVVKALPAQIPDVLYYDAEKLQQVGDTITVADIVVPANVQIETDAAHAVATVFEPRAVAAANESAGGDAEEASEPVAESAEAATAAEAPAEQA